MASIFRKSKERFSDSLPQYRKDKSFERFFFVFPQSLSAVSQKPKSIPAITAEVTVKF